MQKRFTYIISFILSINLLSAQSNFIDGGIIQTNGDTVLGQLDYQEWTLNPRTINFRKIKTFGTKTYDANSITGFFVKEKNEFYHSAIVDINMETLEPKDLPNFNSKREAFTQFKLKRDTVFLLLVAGGEINMYEYTDKIRTRFLVKKGKEPVKELLFREVGINKDVERAVDIVYLKDYQTQLNLLTNSCSTMKINFDKLRFSKPSLLNVINKYNKCTNSTTYNKEKEKTERFITIFTGAGVPLLFVNSTYPQKIKLKYIYGGIAPLIGLEVCINSGRDRGRKGAGLGFRASKYSHQYIQDEIGYIANAAYFRFYSFYKQTYNAKLNPFVKAGVGLSHFTKNESILTVQYPWYDKPSLIPIRSISNNFDLFVGTGLQKGRFSFELQYEINTNLAYFNRDTRIKANQISLLVGYKFYSVIKQNKY
jgi:hypothetical protein